MRKFIIHSASPSDAAVVSSMVQQLLEEIMHVTGSAHFHVDLAATTQRCERFLTQGMYAVFIALETDINTPVGFISLTETCSLYAEGVFGIMPELYVQPAFRSSGVGELLLDAAKAYGWSKGWQRLEVTTPPLPEFDRTLAFYQRNDFEVAGGRKMKVLL